MAIPLGCSPTLPYGDTFRMQSNTPLDRQTGTLKQINGVNEMGWLWGRPEESGCQQNPSKTPQQQELLVTQLQSLYPQQLALS